MKTFVGKRLYHQLNEREREELKSIDPWLFNKLLNHWEQKNNAISLESYPLDLSLPFIDSCNAKCIFCSYWGCKPRFMSEVDLLKYREVFKYLAYVGINPAGEPLLHPQFDYLVTRIREMVDPRCSFYLVTNGTHLATKKDVIINNIDTLTVSLNAASPKTHQNVFGVDGKFKQIISDLKFIIKSKKKETMNVYATFIVLKQNIHEIPQFIKLCTELCIDRIYFRNLATANPNNPIKPGYNPQYLALQPNRHSEFKKLQAAAEQAIDTADIDIVAEPQEWGVDIEFDHVHDVDLRSVPDYTTTQKKGSIKTDPDNEGWIQAPKQMLPFTCQYLYKYMIDPRLSNIQPVCVYMEQLPGYDPIALDLLQFDKVRNAPAMKALRKALRDGPLIPAICTRCNILNAFKHSDL